MKLLLFSILLLFNFFSFSQTNISGSIFSSTTWTQNNSPYIVSGNLVIFQDAHLTIEPGVIVRFEQGAGIELRGTMSALGNSSNRIVFTSNLPSPFKGSWAGIKVLGTTNPLGVGDQLTMEFVDGEYANVFVNLEAAYHGPYIFKHCYFSQNTKVNEDGGMPLTSFDYCKFDSNTQGLDWCQFESLVTNCEFTNNVKGLVGIATIENCYFSGNTEFGLEPYGITTGCTIVNNTLGVKGSFNSVNHTFTNNIVQNNVIGIDILGFFNDANELSGNQICNNSDYNVRLLNSNNADLSNNCWCSEDDTYIRSTIFDGYVDNSYGLVTFNPTLTPCELSTGELNPEKVLDINIYPVPFKDHFSIEIASEKNFNLTLYDFVGRVILETTVNRTSRISTEELIPGTFIYTIRDEDKIIKTGKLIKQ